MCVFIQAWFHADQYSLLVFVLLSLVLVLQADTILVLQAEGETDRQTDRRRIDTKIDRQTYEE